MSHVESYRDRQDNEFEVLEAIFGDEIKDLRKNRNKRRWQPMDLIITLTPQQGMSGPVQVYAQIDLRVVCGDKYPEDVPHFQITKSRGLSDKQIAVLFSELHDLAKNLKGEVMILELTQHIQKFLHENNKPSYSSFYEEMVFRRQERIQYEMQEKQLKESKERQVLQDEIQKRQEALKAELRDRREPTRLSMESSVLSQSIPSSPQERVRTSSRRRCMSTSESSDGLLCNHRNTELVHFDNNKGKRQVHRGKCLGHSMKGSVVYAGVDMNTNEFFAITEWTLKYDNVDESSNGTTDLQRYMKQIGSIEQELNHLHRLHHPNLVRYVDMTYYQKENTIIIYILQEFVVGTTCASFLMKRIPMAINMLRYLALEILSALEYLHGNNIVHKDLRDTSVYIDRLGTVKVADYSLHKRLSDVYHSKNDQDIQPDFPTIQGRGGKKLDIYRFGILLLSLYKGTIVSEEKIDWGSNLPPELRDFICKCLNSDERARWSAKQLQQHSFIRTPLKRELSPPQLYCNEVKHIAEPEEPASDIPLNLPTPGGHSRIRNEFEILKWLGKGAFGDVLKVRNKLDGGIYAIKRIALNPKNKQLNKKITREVKLLSRLNHENVVRYYNSWIESTTLEDSTRHSTFTPATTPSIQTNTIEDVDEMESENIEQSTPPNHDVERGVSYESRASVANSGKDTSDSASDSDSDEVWGFLLHTNTTDSSDNIEFRADSESHTSESQSQARESSKKDEITIEESNAETEIQFMYIQMEFCEKSTLRTAIDNGLYKDSERVWRLFREMVEGITHIHQQGMIHRDLKPVNIFLDSNDHVKIGDFGLATTNILSTLTQTTEAERETQPLEKCTSYDTDELESMTGQVGTALYAAPELTAKAAKAIYNQKVDIYSLGIILFEMWYKPLTTGMERVKVLLSVRSKDIILPTDITEAAMPNQVVELLRWLLNHDPSQRPTSQELLVSEYLPPVQLEEAELQELVRHTLTNCQSKAYKYLISCCFAQEVTPAENITYDMNLPSRGVTSSLSLSNHYLHEYAKSSVLKVFRRHGGFDLAIPLLMPNSEKLYNLTESSVKLMTHSGSIVCIPHDLRLPFARYVVWNNILHCRRYAIRRVYREKKCYGFHPRELYECAFDIISTTKNLIAEAELIYVVWEIFNEIPELKQRNFKVRVNHTSLLHAVLMYCGIEEEKYQAIYSILCDARDGKLSKFQVQTHFISLCLTDQAMETLFNLFDTESSVLKITSVLKTIIRRRDDAAVLANRGLREIKIVTAHAEALGVKWPITVVPLLAHNMQQHTGIIFHVTCEVKRRRRCRGQEVIAAGGRYDKMLMSFRQILERAGLESGDINQHGVGISISLDKLVSTIDEFSEESCFEKNSTKFGLDVAIGCVDGSPKRDEEMVNVLRELWTLDLHVTALDLSTTAEILEYCRENSIGQVIILRSGEKGNFRLHSWERDRYQERKICINDLVDHLQRQTENTLPVLNRSESRISTNIDIPISSNNPVNINVHFVLSERDKLSGSGRRSSKNSMLTQMASSLQRISYKVPIEVFAVFLDMSVIRTMVSLLEIDEREQDFERSIQLVIDKHPRHKKYINQICDEISEVRSEKPRPVLVLYSLSDNHFKVLL